MLKSALCAAVASLSFASAASAAVVFSDDFNSYADQAAFNTVWSDFVTTPQLSTAQSNPAGGQSVFVPGSTTLGYRVRKTLTTTAGVVSPTNTVVFSFDFYDSGSNLFAPQRNYSTIQVGTGPTGNNSLISLGLNNNQNSTQSGGSYYMARIVGYSPVAGAADPDGGPAETVGGTDAFFKLNDFGVGLRPTSANAGWRNLKVEISTTGLTTDYAFYVNNVLAERVSGITGTLQDYNTIALGSNVSNAGMPVYFDNVSLSNIEIAPPVPEPMMAGVALPALALLRRKRR